MDTLIELTKIVNRKRLSKIDVFDKTFLNKDNTNLYYQLYSGIESGKIKNDDDAGKLLYGTNKSDTRFKMLKSRYKSKLLKTILLFNKDELFNNDAGRVYYECITDFQTIEVLVKLTGTSKLVIELIKEKYSICLEYKFYDILIKYSYYLISYYSLSGQVKKYYIEQENFFSYTEKSKYELLAKQLYCEAILQFTSSQPINETLLNKIKKCISGFEPLLVKCENVDVYYFYYYVRLLYEESVGNLNGIKDLCDKIDVLLEFNKYISAISRLITTHLYRLKFFLHLRKYEEGILLYKKDDSFYPLEKGYNWFVLKEF